MISTSLSTDDDSLRKDVADLKQNHLLSDPNFSMKGPDYRGEEHDDVELGRDSSRRKHSKCSQRSRVWS